MLRLRPEDHLREPLQVPEAERARSLAKRLITRTPVFAFHAFYITAHFGRIHWNALFGRAGLPVPVVYDYICPHFLCTELTHA